MVILNFKTTYAQSMTIYAYDRERIETNLLPPLRKYSNYITLPGNMYCLCSDTLQEFRTRRVCACELAKHCQLIAHTRLARTKYWGRPTFAAVKRLGTPVGAESAIVDCSVGDDWRWTKGRAYVNGNV